MKVYLLLDRSGSMISMWEEALSAINLYISKLAKKTKVCLATFDSVSYDVVRDTTVSKWEPISKKEIYPRGGTPLNDSLAKIVLTMLTDSPDKAVLVVMTDGEENSSSLYQKKAVENLLNAAKEKGYESVFLGANFEKITEEARSYGISLTRSAFVNPSNFNYAFDNLAKKTILYAHASSSEASACMDFSDNEKENMREDKSLSNVSSK